MIKISHRGNIYGTNPQRENSLSYINEALAAGFHVEADFWKVGDRLYLGHDFPKYELMGKDFAFLICNERIFLHCKNLQGLHYLLQNQLNVFCDFFAHDKDPWALTNCGFIWTNYGQPVTKNSIIVDLENKGDYNCFGVCSDNWL